MVDAKLLLISVITLFCYMALGFVLRKTKIADENFSKYMSVYTIYAAQASMLIFGFLVEFEKSVMLGVLWVFILATLVHSLYYVVVISLFKNAPDKIRTVLRFAIMFSNAGYMGIPVISDVLGEEYVIYATVYIAVFNIFGFSLGRLIYTNDKKYITIKSIIINPAVIPIIIGFLIFITGIGGWIQSQLIVTDKNIISSGVNIVYNVITTLKNTVAPASMILIGCRLAEIDFKGIFKDKYLYPFLIIRHLALPLVIWAFIKAIIVLGVLNGKIADTVIAVILVLCSTPSAALTTMFAELYGGDARYSGKLVAISTLLSVVTMPIVALLLKI